MAAAPVGDDQFGEDPSVNRLQEEVAALLGKEAGLFVPSGTMANQLALKAFTQPGDDVIVGRESHAVWHEAGAGAANAGVQFSEIGTDGLYTPEELEAAIKPLGHPLYPPTTLIQVENTQNRKGGLVWDPKVLKAIGAIGREHGIATYLDGARLLNAAAARKDSPARLAEPFDLVSIALSKGLGCPVGSVLAGRAGTIERLVRHRRMMGGALRQAGILAAAGSYALEHNWRRLVDDHANARRIGETVAAAGATIDLSRLETNIVVFGTDDAHAVVEKAREEDVHVMAFGPRTIRAVTHMDVSELDCALAADVLAAAIRR